jgi:hypothetical protein
MSILNLSAVFVGKERNTMYIIGSLIKKIKQAVKAIKNRYSVNEVTDEQLRLDHDELMAEYQQACREEDERQAREQKELMADILEDQRLERQIALWEAEEEWGRQLNNRLDNEKGNDWE